MELLLRFILGLVDLIRGTECALFCSVCYFPVRSNEKICPHCQRKTTPLNIIKRVRCDNSLPAKARGIFRTYAVLNIIAASFQFIYCITAIIVLALMRDVPLYVNVVGIILFSVFDIGAIIWLWLGVRVFSERDSSFESMNLFFGIYAFGVLFSLNVVSAALYMIASYTVDTTLEPIIKETHVPKEIYIKRKMIENGIASEDWICDNCGYINKNMDFECKSCGKYK
ncbi:MAG: hypothetical protein K2G32_11695 [Oscillospiraceae bacterium]|nr:hypothetical protein [Oscillospiraceae bacterium]